MQSNGERAPLKLSLTPLDPVQRYRLVIAEVDCGVFVEESTWGQFRKMVNEADKTRFVTVYSLGASNDEPGLVFGGEKSWISIPGVGYLVQVSGPLSRVLGVQVSIDNFWNSMDTPGEGLRASGPSVNKEEFIKS